MVKLTEYSHGAGCGCKIAPAVLDRILAGSTVAETFPGLLVGNRERDDAAVFDLGDGTAAISTTDFFMPIVDDAETFGRIAATNAISDVYAMGGTPLMAIAILGWPVNELAPEIAGRVVNGGRQACSAAGIPLAGGHSIDSPEPIFGLAVTGRVAIESLKKNGGARVGDLLFLTKPLGVGILSTAQKQKKLRAEHAELAVDLMVQLNAVGPALATIAGVHAITDVTGFGLLGHLGEMCAASQTTAALRMDEVPLLDREVLDHYLAAGCVPGGTRRNLDSYGHRMQVGDQRQRSLLADPQTSGGLLVSASPAAAPEVIDRCAAVGITVSSFGTMLPARKGILVEVS